MNKFDFVKDKDIRKSLYSGYETIDELQLRDWLKTFDGSFVFNRHQKIKIIEETMFAKDGVIHSGASFSLVMRNLEMIAKYEYDHWYSQMFNNL